MSDEVLLGELRKRRGEVVEMLKEVPNNEQFEFILRELDERIAKLERSRWDSYERDKPQAS
jgi:hypothetical protein